jgi:hypothetical protein
MDIIPVTVTKAVNTEQTHSWNEAMETQQDDIAGYGTYVLNKVIQSIVGSASSEFSKIFTNEAWLENAVEEDEKSNDKIALREQWIAESTIKASQLRGMYDIVKSKQLELLVNDGVKIKAEGDEDYDPDAWHPTLFAPFPYNEELTRKNAQKMKISKKAEDARVKLDQKQHKFVEQQMAKVSPGEPTGDMLFTYTQKILQTTSMYYDRNIEKQNEHFQMGKDQLSEDSRHRAENLKFACEQVHAILQEAAAEEFSHAA